MAKVKYSGVKTSRPRQPFTTSVELQTASFETVLGVATKKYISKGNISCLWKTFGGTETEVNGQIVVTDTVQVQTWFRDDIDSSARLILNGKVYEIMGEPEDIEQRHQFMRFKVKRVGGNG